MLAKQPKFIQAYMALGVIYDAEGNKVEARKMYEKALEVNPNFAPAANNLAWILLLENEDPDRALDLAKRAKAQLPDDPNVADTLGLALIHKGVYTAAIAELSEAAEKMPEHSTVLYHLGLAFWKNGEKEKAIEALEKALKMKGDFPEREEAKKLLEEIQIERT
jgi:Flp pilus assembly protein TadD